MSDANDAGGSLARIDLPIRDVLRFIVPGGYGAVSAAFLDHLIFQGSLGFANSSVLVPAGFIFGLVAFVGSFHSRFWPWKKHWHSEMEAIAKEINAITGSELARREEFAKPIYKLWIEAVCRADLRGYIHYKTGIYYSTAAVSVISVVSGFACFCWLVYSGYVFASTSGHQGVKDILSGGACLAVYFLMALLTYWMSRSYLKEVATQGRIAMELDTSRHELVRLARAATRIAADFDDKQAVPEIVKSVLLDICPAELEFFQAAQCDKVVDQLETRNGSVQRVAHITLTSTEPSVINGGSNLYQGDRQRVLESALAMRLCARLNVDAIRLQIAPIGDFWTANYQPSTRTVRALRLDKALKEHVVTKDSPIERCCKKYGITSVFVRGRFVIGPSPGLAAVLERELKTMKSGLRVFDPFAGTRLVEQICRQHDSTAAVSSSDKIDADGNALPHDSFATPPPQQDYDLAVIDPLYEDCLAYLELVGTKIRSKKFIVQSGRICDVRWNEKIELVLQKLGTVERSTYNTFGSCIFVVTKS